MGYIEQAKAGGGEVLVGGTGDASVGFFVQPTVILTHDPRSVTMVEEIFGPVLTVFVYEDEDFDRTLEMIDNTTSYALTGSMCVRFRHSRLRIAADAEHAVVSPPTAPRSCARRPRCGTRRGTCTTTRSAPARSSASSRSAARARAGRTTRRAASRSSTAS
jgi:acyl-CoA reductase-like NAD-dependent aldehyde dehydrogenase